MLAECERLPYPGVAGVTGLDDAVSADSHIQTRPDQERRELGTQTA